jgi:F0F1-type ATP synthase assembly protein I
LGSLVNKVKKQLYRLVFWQLVVIAGLALILFLLQGIRVGLSAFFGGLAYWLPTLFFMWRVSSHAGARAAHRFLVAFMSGEVIKLAFSGALFILFAQYLHLDLVYEVVGLIGAIIAFWIVSIVSVLKEGVKS